MPIDPRFLREDGNDVFNGNELLVKGCLETPGGVHLMTGYPGSPVAAFFDVMGALGSLLKDKGIRAFQAGNEALSVAAVNGSQMAPCRAITAFKSVGVHVASDALALGNLAGAHAEGGAVIVCGDDPWCDSTQVPADSRFLCEHLRMPVVEPGSAQEVKDWIGASFELSRVGGCYIGYIATTNQVDGGGTVACRPNHYPALNTNQRIALESSKVDLDKLLLPPRTWQHELAMPDRHAVTIKAARKLGINRIAPATRQTGLSRCPLGFVVTGMAGQYLQHVLADVGLAGVFPVLHMGMSYPADVHLVAEFAKQCDQMIVIEERRSFLEKNIRDRLHVELDRETANDLSSRLWGKQFPQGVAGVPEGRGLNPSLLATIILPLIQRTHAIPGDLRNGQLTAELERIKATGKRKIEVLGGVSVKPDVKPEQIDESTTLARTPTFCPGCPHRDSSALLLEVRKNLQDADYMRRKHRRGTVDLIAHGDTGCYTMLMFPPTEQLMHNYSGMGLGGGTGSGIDPFITNKQIVFMGDGTFFHSGSAAISNAIKANQDITFIILENKTTAMTGHQEHAGTEVDTVGNRSYIQDIYQVCRGMRGTSPMTVTKANPADRDKWKKTLEKTILADGVKVLIADKECGITFYRREKKAEAKLIKQHGFLPEKRHMNVTPEVCENCLECTKATACPGLIPIDTPYGPKIDTDLTWCVNDGACERVRVSNDDAVSAKPCPSFEQVIIKRSRRRKYKLPYLDLGRLPDPAGGVVIGNAPWRVHMTGVGGMGIGIIGAILVKAGHYAGYHCVFNEKKGLAIRNGGVFAQIAWVRQEARHEGTEARRHEGEERESSSDSARVPSCHTTGLIPYGRADLLLGVDILESARAVDPRADYRVAMPDRTAAVLNTFKQPTVSGLLGVADFDPAVLTGRILEKCDAARSYANDLGSICEQHLGSKQYVNIMMLGVAYQLGLVPAPATAMAKAIRDIVRRDVRKNLKAFNIGRRLALAPNALTGRAEPQTWQDLLVEKQRILRAARFGGQNRALRLEHMVHGALEAMPGLKERARLDLTLRIYDLMQWGGPAYARRYVDLVRGLHRRDSADQKYAATHAAILGLAKVMLIKDEPYVAYLLTRHEKRVRDMAKYNVDPANGDRIIYRHHTSPEFPVGKRRIRIKLTSRDWMLKVAAACTFVRNVPGWHAREQAFRDWYADLLPRLDLQTDAGYRTAVDLLEGVLDVTGYREVRYPKQRRYKEAAEATLARPHLHVTLSDRLGSRARREEELSS